MSSENDQTTLIPRTDVFKIGKLLFRVRCEENRNVWHHVGISTTGKSKCTCSNEVPGVVNRSKYFATPHCMRHSYVARCTHVNAAFVYRDVIPVTTAPFLRTSKRLDRVVDIPRWQFTEMGLDASDALCNAMQNLFDTPSIHSYYRLQDLLKERDTKVHMSFIWLLISIEFLNPAPACANLECKMRKMHLVAREKDANRVKWQCGGRITSGLSRRCSKRVAITYGTIMYESGWNIPTWLLFLSLFSQRLQSFQIAGLMNELETLISQRVSLVRDIISLDLENHSFKVAHRQIRTQIPTHLL